MISILMKCEIILLLLKIKDIKTLFNECRFRVVIYYHLYTFKWDMIKGIFSLGIIFKMCKEHIKMFALCEWVLVLLIFA